VKIIQIGVLVLLGAMTPAGTYQPANSNLEARQWFQDAKFGMFIHWGVYSVAERGEWVMENENIPVSAYEPLAAKFNPTEFDAAEWVALAKRAGMKYITITTKHHDGFAMYGTKQNKWNVVDATPWKKDPIKLLADECHRQGIKIFFYYSLLDWHHPDYYPLGRTGHSAGRPVEGDWNRYLDFMDAQLKELLTGYGEVDGICFDGWWDKPHADWQLRRTYDLIHSLQPATLITNNHHRTPYEGEDYQIFEQDLPGHNAAGFNREAEKSALPLETAATINESWGYNRNDTKFKSTESLIQYLVRAAGHGANLDLNVGPMSNGKIQPEFVEALDQIGDWMRKNGETIYGTRGGPVPPQSWGAMTQKGDRFYVHILKLQAESLTLPHLPPLKAAAMFVTGAKVDMTSTDNGYVLHLQRTAHDAIDTIVVLEKR